MKKRRRDEYMRRRGFRSTSTHTKISVAAVQERAHASASPTGPNTGAPPGAATRPSGCASGVSESVCRRKSDSVSAQPAAAKEMARAGVSSVPPPGSKEKMKR